MTVPHATSTWPDLGHFAPDRVLDEYDGPRLFTLRSTDGLLLLAYQCGEDATTEQFVIVPADDHLIDDLLKNRLPLRDALTDSSWAWLVHRYRDGTISAPAAIDLGALPPDALPEPGVRLGTSEEPLLRLRMTGDGVTADHVPASVVRRAVDGATSAVRVLVRHALRMLPVTGRPTDSFRRYYDLPAVEIAFGSFEIAFGTPAQGQMDLMERGALEKVRELLTLGLRWAVSEQTDALPQADGSAIVEALAKLAPPQRGAVDVVEVSGALTGRPSAALKLTRAASERISDARKALTMDRLTRTHEGYIREFDKDRLTFTLRSPDGGNLCVVNFSEDQYEDAWLAFGTERAVTIVTEEIPGMQLADLISITFSSRQEPKPTLPGGAAGPTATA